MRLSEQIRQAIWGVSAWKGRSLALVVALACAITTIALLLAIVVGFSREIERTSFGAYARALVISENLQVFDRYGPPRLRNIPPLRAAIPEAESAAAWRSTFVQFTLGQERRGGFLYGAAGAAKAEIDADLAAGRFLNESELAADGSATQRVCVIGATIAANLCTDGAERCLDERLRVNGRDCAILGVLEPSRSVSGRRFDGAVITTFGAAARQFEVETQIAADETSWITLLLPADADRQKAQTAADLLLRKAVGAPLSQPPPFSYQDPSVDVRDLARQRRVFGQILLLVGITACVGGFVAFGSVIAAAINERRREFSLRLTFGATPGDLAGQIAIEALLVGLISGACAILLTLVAVVAAQGFVSIPLALSLDTLLANIAVGLFIALYGAWPVVWRIANAPVNQMLRQ